MLGTIRDLNFTIQGRAFMYLLAFGDWIFRGVLHLCSEPANAAFLTVLLLNVACLFGAIIIFARHCDSSLFLPSCLLVSLAVIWLIHRANYSAAITDVWLPHMLLFVFLLFLALRKRRWETGEISDIPLLVLCAGFLVHGHVAQILFVSVLGAGALSGLLVNKVPRLGWRGLLRTCRKSLLWSAVIAAIFIMPIVLERAVNHPNNIHQVLAYLSRVRGERKSFGSARRSTSLVSFFTPTPETKLPGTTVGQLVAAAREQPGVSVYWLAVFVLCGIVALLRMQRQALGLDILDLQHVSACRRQRAVPANGREG